MKFGIWAPLPHTIRSEPEMKQAIAELTTPGAGGDSDSSFEFACAILQQAEAAGFSISLIAERWLGPDLESWVMASALSQRTSRMELMVAAHPGIVTPQAVAKMGASLDRISGGRFAINLVNGWWPDELNLFGNGSWLEDSAERAARLGEFVQVLRGLWTQDDFSFHGRYYDVDKASLPLKTRRTPPPIYAASRSPEGKALVAESCDLWFADYVPDYRLYESNLADMTAEIAEMKALAAGHGRELQIGLSAHVICAPTSDEALARAEELLEYGKTSRIAAVAARGLGAGLVGTAEQLAERIEAYERIGVDCLMLRFHPMAEGLTTFAEEVMPLLRERVPVAQPEAVHG
ncbi:LLM class flavin-dependent oxidoreductase [Bosea sp. BH3]|uniref:LLM class flavin-dependent oxidoreductase n=1 Tax=Bosea sp. BH3 TaxID=2871701 RepID=UPI0021CAFAF5|nr:LLM class flavin-dependent oxidoreductase [Bosea sp. BH3]MCU4181566.1 LLM class flavin-dependent oxidoreductase [Bosea sp. BH3]